MMVANTARSGAKRRKIALDAEIQRLNESESGLDWEQNRLDHALRGEEVPRPTTWEDAKAAAEARFRYIQTEDFIETDPEMRAELDDIRLRDATEEAEREIMSEAGYGGGGGGYEAPAGGGLTDTLESSLYGGGNAQ